MQHAAAAKQLNNKSNITIQVVALQRDYLVKLEIKYKIYKGIDQGLQNHSWHCSNNIQKSKVTNFVF
jgi:hypothetical protein